MDDMRREIISQFINAVETSPGCAMHFAVALDETRILTRGMASVSDLAHFAIAVINDAKVLHTPGHCASCDAAMLVMLEAEKIMRAGLHLANAKPHKGH